MNVDKETQYEKAASWAFSRERTLRTSSRIAWGIAAVACVVALAEAFALASLAPLKSVTPIPLLVDRQTGFVQTLKSDGRSEIRADAALTQSLLAQYVIARESYNIASVSADYRKTMLWSADEARADYASLMPRQNPLSPLNLYPRSSTLETTISSVSPLSPQVYLVRFTTTRHDLGVRLSQPHHWAAVLTFRFIDAPMKLEDRLANPLGFQVIRYHRDEEGVSAEVVAAASQTENVIETSSQSAPPSGLHP
jgi:type IV secretion system protein VirB8